MEARGGEKGKGPLQNEQWKRRLCRERAVQMPNSGGLSISGGVVVEHREEEGPRVN